MNIEELGVTSEHLVVETKKLVGLRNTLWYSSPEGKFFLDATNRNQLAFTWEGCYQDGTIFRQYDDVTFLRALRDSQFVPSVDQITSTEILDKARVVEYNLYPIAFTRKFCPWYQSPYRLVIHPEKGERLVACWLTDFRREDGFRVRRHLAGIKYEDGRKLLLILSPSGSMVLAGTENISFDGE